MWMHISVEIKIAPSPRLRHIVELNLCWNNVIHRLFNCMNLVIGILAVLLGLGRLIIPHLILLR